jgi:hypothetical protein
VCVLTSGSDPAMPCHVVLCCAVRRSEVKQVKLLPVADKAYYATCVC